MTARSTRASGRGTTYPTENELAQHLYQALNRTRFGGLLPECEVRFSARLTSSGGMCYPARQQIRLSIHLLRQHGWPEIAETLVHEMAHVWVHLRFSRRGRRRPRPHGPEFQAVLAAVGGQRRYCPPFSTGRTTRLHVYHCPQGHEFLRQRRLSPWMLCAVCARARLPAVLSWIGQRADGAGGSRQ